MHNFNYNLYHASRYNKSGDELKDIFVIQLIVMSMVTTIFLVFLHRVFSLKPIKTLTIVRGLPGSGKSTWVKGVVRNTDKALSINMDNFVTAGGDSMREAGMKTVNLLLHILESGDYDNIFIEGIFSRKWEYEIFETLASRYDYRFKLIHIVGLKNDIEMFKRSEYINSDGMWDLRWCKFLKDNWEEDNRAIFVDLEDSESEYGDDSETGEVYSYFNVEDTVEDNCRYNLRSRKVRH